MFRFPPLTPLVKKALIAIAATFVVTVIIARTVTIPGVASEPYGPIFSLLALSPAPGLHWGWQIFTHAWVYPADSSGFMNALVGLIFLWWIAAPFEKRFGARTTMVVSLLSVVAFGIGATLASLVVPSAPQFGVNPMIVGLIAGFAAVLPPNAPLSFFGALKFKPKALIFFIIGLSAFMALLNQDYAGFVGDLAAIGIGVLYMRRRLLTPRKPAKKKRAPGSHGFTVIDGEGGDKPKYLN